jgi:hypothetical protein
MMKRSLVTLGLALSTQLAACMVGDSTDTLNQDLTFEEFKALTYLEPWADGVYIINGDTPVHNEKALYEEWLAIYGGQELIVNTSGGVDTKWSDTQKLNLTYCVSDTFGANKTKVLAAFDKATTLGWEVRGNVNFIHLTAQDANCTASNTNVVFDVRPVNVGGQYLARAFFPNNARSSRNVLIDNTAFDPNLTWPLENIIAHELGHALGFRHEHTRPESGACFEDNNWRPLTPYDSASVMHYPQCNGTSSNLAFTQRDTDGIVALYGAPGGNPPPPPPPPPPRRHADLDRQPDPGVVPRRRWADRGALGHHADRDHDRHRRSRSLRALQQRADPQPLLVPSVPVERDRDLHLDRAEHRHVVLRRGRWLHRVDLQRDRDLHPALSAPRPGHSRGFAQ